ncbi:MAG: S-layer homology domain-containing protein [bacterium]
MLTPAADHMIFEAPIGARVLGMGGVTSVLEGETEGLYYNPASFYGSRTAFLGFTSGSNLGIAQAYTAEFGAFGVSYQSVIASGVQRPDGTFSSLNATKLTLGYAARLQSLNAVIGINLRNVRVAFGAIGSGSDIDIGLLTHPMKGIVVGVTAQNALSSTSGSFGSIQSSEGKDGIPGKVLFGMGFNISGPEERALTKASLGELFLGVEGEMKPAITSYPTLVRVGLEWRPNPLLGLRVGQNQEADALTKQIYNQMTAGASIAFADFEFQYAYFPSSLGNTENKSYFSILLNYLPEEGLPEDFRTKGLRPDSLQISYPPRDFTTYDSEVQVSGKVLEGITLKINSRDVFIAPDLTFQAKVPLKVGKNVIEAVATKGSKYLTIQKNVLYKIPVRISAGSNLTDTQKVKVENLATLGIVDIPTEGFDANKQITRAELAAWLAKAKGLHAVPLSQDPFSDVSRMNKYASYIKMAVDQGWMNSYPDRTFKPDQAVSEEEAKEVFRVFDQKK